MDRPGTCIIILDKKYNIANSSCHFGSYGSIWTGPSPNKYYMDLRSSGSYNISLVTDRYIYCHMTLSAIHYLLYVTSVHTTSSGFPVDRNNFLNDWFLFTVKYVVFQLYKWLEQLTIFIPWVYLMKTISETRHAH